MADASASASTSAHTQDDALPAELHHLAQQLLAAAKHGTLADVSFLLDAGAPAWFQDADLGWSALFYAAERREPDLIARLLRGGAVWNAVDHWGRTAGEVCLSLGDEEGWRLIRNEGVRAEMLHHALGAQPGAAEGGTITLRAEDDTSAGDNLAFLASKLTWDLGEDGRERVLDADGNGVMMGWEEPLMKEHVRLMTGSHPAASANGGPGMSILNVGYGLGIVDRLFQATAPQHHVIIEAHPDVLAHMRRTGVDRLPGVTILEGRWQDWVLDPEKLEALLAASGGAGFDAVFVDTFAEGYEDLKAFFEALPDVLEAQHGIFSFWNGLGATNATIYAVSSTLADLHLDDCGLDVEWTDVPIEQSLAEEVWRGVRRKYWELPSYRLPIAKMRLA